MSIVALPLTDEEKRERAIKIRRQFRRVKVPDLSIAIEDLADVQELLKLGEDDIERAHGRDLEELMRVCDILTAHNVQ